MGQMKRVLAGLILLSCLLLLGVSCSGAAPAAISPVRGDVSPAGLRIQLGEAREGTSEPQRTSPAPVVERLSEEETRRVLDRLPPLSGASDENYESPLPVPSLPPPRPGNTLTTPFPPREAIEAPARPPGSPLEVAGWTPDGDAPLVQRVSVTFSQPMLALGGQEEPAPGTVPIEILPSVPGKWRWLTPQTLLFEAAERFPMATGYTVDVPAGMVSDSGGKLGRGKRFIFSTPPPKVVAKFPEFDPTTGRSRTSIRIEMPDGGTRFWQDGVVSSDPLVFVGFDQRIDPRAVLGLVEVEAGNEKWPIRLANEKEIRDDPGIRQQIAKSQDGRYFVFGVGRPLPPGARVNVRILPGVPSIEGPRRSTRGDAFFFGTCRPLQVTGHRCEWQIDSRVASCSINFENDLDEDAFRASMVIAESETLVEDLHVSGSSLSFKTRSRSATRILLKLDPAIRDEFGQTLGKPLSLSLEVLPAEKRLYSSPESLVVLDPGPQPVYSVFSVNIRKLKVRVYSVGPADFPAFLEGAGLKPWTPPPWKLAFERLVFVEGGPDEIAETKVEPFRDLRDGLGHAVVDVRDADPVPPERSSERGPVVQKWVQATRIGLDAFVDRGKLVAWATSLADGSPLKGVDLKIEPDGSSAVTYPTGVASLPLPETGGRYPRILVARKDGDVAFLPERIGGSRDYPSSWRVGPPRDLDWHVFDDRRIYKPGEKVHVKGWVRRIVGDEGEDLRLPAEDGVGILYHVFDPRQNEIGSGKAAMGRLGGFDLAFDLPKASNLGWAELKLETEETSPGGERAEHSHLFQIQEFRRPEFEVSARASEGPHLAGETAVVTAKAAYYTGAALPDTVVNWEVRWRSASFAPPNREGFSFGPSIYGWGGDGTSGWPLGGVARYEGRTDELGKHGLRIDLEQIDPPGPVGITAEANVTDVNRRQWKASSVFLVHPSDVYVGLRAEPSWIHLGQVLSVDVIVTDLDGRSVAGAPVHLSATRFDWKWEANGRDWKKEEHESLICEVVSAEEPVRCDFEPKNVGDWRVRAVAQDSKGRRTESGIFTSIWGEVGSAKAGTGRQRVRIVPDRTEYQPGETARLLLQAPFHPAEGLVTVRRQGIVRTDRFRMNAEYQAIEIPIAEGFLPSAEVEVDLVGSGPRTNNRGEPDESLPRRPASASGSVDLPVPPRTRRLTVSVEPEAREASPGSRTKIAVEVRDATGKPTGGAEVALVVVDEAVLDLAGYSLPDPIASFYPPGHSHLSHLGLRDYLQLAILPGQDLPGPPVVEMMACAVSSSSDPESEKRRVLGESRPIRSRIDFDPLVAFVPALITDDRGRAETEVRLPDNLTRYRVVAVAAAGEKLFGKGESTIEARLPLMARPSPPRFLNSGDRFDLPIVVQNQTEERLAADVVVRAANARLSADPGRRVDVPAGQRVEVRFPVETILPGTARFQVGVASGNLADAASVDVPVYAPVTARAFAEYGVIDQGAVAQPIQTPAGALPGFGGVEITTSSTALHSLAEAVLYLVRYPYDCTEQIASRALAILALRDVLPAFESPQMPTPPELEETLTRDLREIEARQNADGGFHHWAGDSSSGPFESVHASHALALGWIEGFAISPRAMEGAGRYLARIGVVDPGDEYSIESASTVAAYAAFVRHLMGDVMSIDQTDVLLREVGMARLPVEALGWILPVLSSQSGGAQKIREIEKELRNRAMETAGAASFLTSYSDGGQLILHSERRADAVVLRSLIETSPKSPLIPKLVQGLLAHKVAGKWRNTQENVFVLLALGRYFESFEKGSPDFVARAWIGNRFLAAYDFKGRSTVRRQTDVPMAFLSAVKGRQSLILAKEGPGRLYYRLGIRYAPAGLEVDPVDRGFSVVRRYEGVDDTDDVRRDSDGTWRAKAGSRIRVRLNLVVPTRRYHVALMDPLPAGLEPLNPEIPVEGRTGAARGGWGSKDSFTWFGPTWYEHQNLRDDRVEAFAALVRGGVYEYSYVARAITLGAYIVPPPKAEEMYSPETFGRGGTDRLIVE